MKTALFTTLVLLAGCKGKESAPTPTEKPAAPVEEKAPPAAAPPPAAPTGDLPAAVTKTVFGFEVNGAPANTARKAGDSDEPMVSYVMPKNRATIALYGDIASQARRGFVTLMVEDFKPAAGEYKAKPRFVRYLDASGNELVMWSGQKGSATVKLDKVVEGTGGAGTKWLANGTFEATGLALDLGQKSETATIDITKGTFTDLEIVTLGR